MYPKITIVTPSYNQAQYLETTILSVLDQKYENLEYIIIDGGSSDESAEIIKKYEKQIYYWISEKDSGQSNALNKGFAKSTGDYLIWVNSDDVLLPGTLKHYAKMINKNQDIQWITGNLVWIDSNDIVIRFAQFSKYSKFLTRLGLAPIGGPSTLFSRECFESVGSFFNENLHYTMDTDLWWRFLKEGYKFTYTDKNLMGFRFHELSKCSEASFKKVINGKVDKKSIERQRVVDKYGTKFSKQALCFYRFRQLINGNYFKQSYNLYVNKNKKWQDIFRE